jgi:hypothetical protein
MVMAKPPTKALEERSVEEEGRRGKAFMKRLSSIMLLMMDTREYEVELSSLVLLVIIMMSNFPF